MPEGPSIKISDELTLDVVDPDNVQPVFADLITEIRSTGNVLCLSFATAVVEGDTSVAHARVCARLRIAGHTVQHLRNLLAQAEQPSEPSLPTGQTLQ